MELLNPNSKDYPGRHINIKVDNPNLDFSEATELAKQKAKEFCADPMMLSWHQGETDCESRHYPWWKQSP